MKVNWQAYLDGSLSAADRAEADRVLAESADARAELAGLRAFIAATAESGRSMTAPSSLIVDVGSPRRANWVRTVSIAVAVPLVAAGAILWIRHDPNALATGPEVANTTTTEADEALAWIENQTGIRAETGPVRSAVLVGARSGKGWACLDFQSAKGEMYLYVRPGKAPFDTAPKKLLGNQTVAMLPQGVGWRRGEVAYYLKGADQATRLQVATEALAN